MNPLEAMLNAFRSIVGWIQGERKKEADAQHEANKKAAEEEIARRQKEQEKP